MLDEDGRVVAASRRARAVARGLREGEPLPQELLAGERALPSRPVRRRRAARAPRLPRPRSATSPPTRSCAPGFTAAVSHELRTPLARLLALLETRAAPGGERRRPRRAGRREVEQIRELIDDVLFLSELESGRAVVSLGATRVMPVLREVAAELEERGRAGGRRPPGRRRRVGRRAAATAADAARRRAEPRRERDPLRRPRSHAHLDGRAGGRQGRLAGHRRRGGRRRAPTCRASSSGSTEPTARGPRAARASGSRS